MSMYATIKDKDEDIKSSCFGEYAYVQLVFLLKLYNWNNVFRQSLPNRSLYLNKTGVSHALNYWPLIVLSVKGELGLSLELTFYFMVWFIYFFSKFFFIILRWFLTFKQIKLDVCCIFVVWWCTNIVSSRKKERKDTNI